MKRRSGASSVAARTDIRSRTLFWISDFAHAYPPPCVVPHSLRFCAASRAVEIHMAGTVTGPEILSACRSLFKHPDWEPGLSTLWLLGDIRSLIVSLDDTGAFAAEAAEFARLRGGGRSAFVCTDVYTQQIALLLAIRTAEAPGGAARSCRLFDRVEDARAWLSSAAEVGGGNDGHSLVRMLSSR